MKKGFRGLKVNECTIYSEEKLFGRKFKLKRPLNRSLLSPCQPEKCLKNATQGAKSPRPNCHGGNVQGPNIPGSKCLGWNVWGQNDLWEMSWANIADTVKRPFYAT